MHDKTNTVNIWFDPRLIGCFVVSEICLFVPVRVFTRESIAPSSAIEKHVDLIDEIQCPSILIRSHSSESTGPPRARISSHGAKCKPLKTVYHRRPQRKWFNQTIGLDPAHHIRSLRFFHGVTSYRRQAPFRLRAENFYNPVASLSDPQ